MIPGLSCRSKPPSAAMVTGFPAISPYTSATDAGLGRPHRSEDQKRLRRAQPVLAAAHAHVRIHRWHNVLADFALRDAGVLSCTWWRTGSVVAIRTRFAGPSRGV